MLARGGDVVVVAADEVPPHDDALLERLAADEQQPGAVLGAQRQIRAPRAQVEQRAGGERRAVDLDRSGQGQRGVLPGRLQRQARVRTGFQHGLGPDERAVDRGG